MHPLHRSTVARLYRPAGRWEDYTNYGILQDFRQSLGNIFPLQMDTWYYHDAVPSPFASRSTDRSEGSSFAPGTQTARGRATLHLDVASLFLPDNQHTLTQTREEWKRLQAVDPEVTIVPARECARKGSRDVGRPAADHTTA